MVVIMTKTPRISLTDFVDIVIKSGTPKATKVKEVKNRPDYEPAFDFYKPLREQIIEFHRQGRTNAQISGFLSSLTDKKKLSNYPALVSGYLRWLGRKSPEWHEPPKMQYRQHGVEVIVNPEMSLTYKGTKHLVKLYFKDEPLDRFRVDIILSLMGEAIGPVCDDDVVMCVLDVRRAKLYESRASTLTLLPLVHAELAYVAALWPQV